MAGAVVASCGVDVEAGDIIGAPHAVAAAGFTVHAQEHVSAAVEVLVGKKVAAIRASLAVEVARRVQDERSSYSGRSRMR